MTSSPIPWKHVRNVLVVFAPLWAGAALLFGILGAGYAVISSDVYSARQPLVVRDEATSSYDRLGRFASQTELKAAQETILEMTQNPEVVAAALREIGPPSGSPDSSWPSNELVEKVSSDAVNLLAPKGSEFGNTEVVYLEVKSKSPERASEFCQALFNNLSVQLRKVRRVRADSVIEELGHARDLAKANLDEVSQKMNEIEVQFGTDLGELRNLNDTISGDGTTRRTLEETTRDLNAAELELERLNSLYSLLVSGAEDPQHLLISGGDLLATQPSLQRLKDGLIDAQLAASQLAGVYTEQNPKRRAALATEKEIKRRMQQETTTAIRSMEPVLRLERERVVRLKERESQLSERLEQLARARTDYSKIDAEVKNRSSQLADAERSLSDAKATRSAALSTNLVAELGPPRVSEKPIGPSAKVMTLGSTMAGLIFGLGTVFLIAPGPSQVRGGRRWSDYLGRDRRAEDQVSSDERPRADDPAAKRQP
jgi:uncharacterized protein involved in exopolysaccharide biosynthesis